MLLQFSAVLEQEQLGEAERQDLEQMGTESIISWLPLKTVLMLYKFLPKQITYIFFWGKKLELFSPKQLWRTSTWIWFDYLNRMCLSLSLLVLYQHLRCLLTVWSLPSSCRTGLDLSGYNIEAQLNSRLSATSHSWKARLDVEFSAVKESRCSKMIWGGCQKDARFLQRPLGGKQFQLLAFFQLGAFWLPQTCVCVLAFT